MVSCRSSVHLHLYELAFVLKIIVGITLCFREGRSQEICATEVPPESSTDTTAADGPSTTDGSATVSNVFLLASNDSSTATPTVKKKESSIYIIGAMLGVDIFVLAIVLGTQAFQKCREKMTSERLVIVLVVPTVLGIVELVLFIVLDPSAFDCFVGHGIYRAAFTFNVTSLLVTLLVILLSFVWPKNHLEKDPVELAEEGKNTVVPGDKKVGEVVPVATTPVAQTAKAVDAAPSKPEENKVVHIARVDDPPVNQKSKKRSQSLDLEKKKSVKLDSKRNKSAGGVNKV